MISPFGECRGVLELHVGLHTPQAAERLIKKIVPAGTKSAQTAVAR